MNSVYLSIGTNIGEKLLNIFIAIKNINKKIGVINSVSSIYESEPWGYKSENSFFNIVLHLNTNLDAIKTLEKCQLIEKQLGRKHKIKDSYSDRILDIDILYFNNQIITFDALQVPHKQIYERQFVLQPMVEIAGNFIDPVCNKTIKQIQEICTDSSKIEKLQELDLEKILTE